MSPPQNVIDVSAGGAFACGLGLTLGISHPLLLPGVVMMCILIFAFDV